MKKWVVRFNDLKTVDKLRELEILSYVPTLYEQSRFVFIETNMSKEEILAIKGITEARESRIATLNI